MKRLATITALCLLTVGCSSPKISVKADAAFTQQAIRQTDNQIDGYGTIDDLTEFYLSLPPPPPTITPHPPIITPPPGAPDPYAPLLAFVQAGPSGSNIQRSHLVQITPAALSLAQLYLSGTVTQQQLFSSAQAWALIGSTQGVLQSLGLWNQQMLQQWVRYLLPRQSQVITITTALYNNIIAPPAPGQPTITIVPPTVAFINPLEVLQRLDSLWETGDWLAVGEQFPDLISPIIKHAGFSKPMIVLYGSRRRYYGVSAVTMRESGGRIEVHNMNQEGYYKNDYASGAGRYFQGTDDISLTYFPVEIERGRVKTLDVVASDRFALLKRFAGGDVDLLNRAYTHNTAAISLDAAFNNRHFRIVGGTTPYASMGGMMGEVTYKAGYLEGRIGGGSLIESSLHGNTDTLLGFLDTEHKLSSPYLTIESEDKKRAMFAWTSLTLSVSAMADRALTHQTDDRLLTGRWGFQGDIRLVPEIHGQVDAEYLSVYIYGGITAAAVPNGKVNLDHPDSSVMLTPVRAHIGAAVRVLISDVVRDRLSGPFDRKLYADAAFVCEVSELVRRWRFTTDLTYNHLRLGLVGEGEDYQFGGIDDFRLGGRARFMGAYVEALKSLELNDFRLQAGFELKL